MESDFSYIIESSKRRIFNFREIWQYRELFYFFAWRDIKVKYKQTTFGLLWVVLQPVLTVIVFTLFFGRALRVPSGDLPYPVFAFSGLLMWNTFSTTVSIAGTSMIGNASIIKKIYFPRIIIPVSSLLVALVDWCIAFLVFLMVVVYYQVPINTVNCLVLWPIAVLIMIAGTLGISSTLAALTVKYRDFRFVIPFGLQIALFISPIIYPSTIINSSILQQALAINPMYGAIMLFRAPLSEVPVDIPLVLISATCAVISLVVGVSYFKKTEAYFADLA